MSESPSTDRSPLRVQKATKQRVTLPVDPSVLYHADCLQHGCIRQAHGGSRCAAATCAVLLTRTGE